MIFPSGDAIERQVSNRYSLVVLSAKRAKQIKEGAPVLIDTDSTNPLTIALEEIAAGKVTIAPDTGDVVPVAPKAALPEAASVPDSADTNGGTDTDEAA